MKALMRIAICLPALWLLGPYALRAQEVIGVSTLSITASDVVTYSATEMDYETAWYYDAEADGYLWQGSSVIRSGSAGGNPTADGYMSAPTIVNNTYEIQTNHWLVAYYYVSGYGWDDPYGYGFISGGGYGGTGDIYAPDTAEYAGVEYFYIGSTYVASTSNAPVITGVQIWSGAAVPGGSGYIVLYGTDLTTYWGPTSVAVDGSGVTIGTSYESPGQINLTYTIDGGASLGNRNITVSTLFGSSSGAFQVWGISSVSPAQGLVGDSFQVTISGLGLTGASGISSDSGISGTIQSGSDTQITVTLTIDPNDSGGMTNIYVNAQAGRSNGAQFFKQIPSNSSVITAKALAAGITYGLNGCEPGEFGIMIDVVYQVLDQNGGAIKSSSMIPQEQDLQLVINGQNFGDQLTTWGNIMGGTSLITAGRTYTDQNGTFEDAPYGLCESSPFTATYTQPMSVLVGTNRYSIRSNHITQTGVLPNTGTTKNSSGDINISVP